MIKKLFDKWYEEKRNREDWLNFLKNLKRNDKVLFKGLLMKVEKAEPCSIADAVNIQLYYYLTPKNKLTVKLGYIWYYDDVDWDFLRPYKE